MHEFGLSLLLASLPVATVAAPTCMQPNLGPEVAKAPVTFALSSFLASAQLHGTTQLLVTLPKDGGFPASVSVKRSSGYDAIDQTAMLDTLKTTFSPERRNCVAVGGQYLYSVDY